MRIRRATLPLALLLLLTVPAGAKVRAVGRERIPPPPHDLFSSSNPQQVQTLHLALDLEIDFAAKQLRGSATHRIVNRTGSDRFILDTRNLQISNVLVDGVPASWSLEPLTRNGQALVTNLPFAAREVRVDYSTLPQSNALSWQDPLQTAGGLAPFLFTFTEPDATRDWIPIQDTPGVRMTYEAKLHVPAGLMAIMSGRNAREIHPDGVYDIDMPHPIAPYLIALAVGRMEFRELSARTGVYCEPELCEDAVWDLQGMPAMLDAAERVMGPYPFDRYDIVLMPAGFHAGGMENPMLNFLARRSVSPGNHESLPSPTEVLAHELAHSWSGDLVTCATWSDIWLNEGFATQSFIDELIDGGVYIDYLKVGEWIDGSNLPSNVTAPLSSGLWTRIGVEAKRLRSGVPAANLATSGWTHFEISVFLWQITDVIPQHMAELDAAFGLSQMKTPSIHWLLAVAATHYAPAVPRFEGYLRAGGPNVVAVYQRMIQTPGGFSWAYEIYSTARERYDTDTRLTVDQILGFNSAKLAA